MRTVIIEKATRTTRISLFGLRGGRHSEKIYLQLLAEAGLKRRGGFKVLAGSSIIQVLAIWGLLVTNIRVPVKFSRI